MKFGPEGDLFVASGQVLRFDGASGASKGTSTSGSPLGEANLIAFGPGGDLFVTDADASQVLRYDGSTGAFESVAASLGPGHFVAGIALGPTLPLPGDANFDGVESIRCSRPQPAPTRPAPGYTFSAGASKGKTLSQCARR